MRLSAAAFVLGMTVALRTPIPDITGKRQSGCRSPHDLGAAAGQLASVSRVEPRLLHRLEHLHHASFAAIGIDEVIRAIDGPCVGLADIVGRDEG